MATFSVSLTASNLTGDIAAARMSTNIRTAISDAGGVRDAETAIGAAIALAKLATAPLTEMYLEIPLLPVALGSSNQGVAMENTSSGTANTRTDATNMTANTLASTDITGPIRRFVVDFARLTGFTITWRVDLQVASGTGIFALRNQTDASDLTTISTTATTLSSAESASITVPAAEKTLDYQVENTGLSVAMRAGNSRLRVKAG